MVNEKTIEFDDAFQAVKNAVNQCDEILDDVRWQIKPHSLYCAVAELFEIYRLIIRHRVRVLNASCRKPAIKEYVDTLNKKLNIKIVKSPFTLFGYLKYYRFTFPKGMKPAQDIVLQRDDEHILDPKNVEDVGPAYTLAAHTFWHLTEWSSFIDRSFLNDRDHEIITKVLTSISEAIKMSIWESIKLNKDLGETLTSIDFCFLQPVEFIGVDVKFTDWLKNIAYIEKW